MKLFLQIEFFSYRGLGKKSGNGLSHFNMIPEVHPLTGYQKGLRHNKLK